MSKHCTISVGYENIHFCIDYPLEVLFPGNKKEREKWVFVGVRVVLESDAWCLDCAAYALSFSIPIA
jgi:hypothetical protein